MSSKTHTEVAPSSGVSVGPEHLPQVLGPENTQVGCEKRCPVPKVQVHEFAFDRNTDGEVRGK